MGTVKELIHKVYSLRYKQLKLYFVNSRSKETLYVIRFYRKEGLMSMLYKACGQVEYAKTMGYIPYIDTKHFSNIYRTTDNSWEYFFSQPLSYYHSPGRKLIISDASGGGRDENGLFRKYWVRSFERYDEKFNFFNSNFKINKEILQQVQIIEKNINIKDCIGLYARGTDYVSLKPKGHFVQPTAEEICQLLNECLLKHNNKVFLVTEDLSIKQYIINEYGERIITIEDDFVFEKVTSGHMICDSVDRKDKIRVGKIYLIKLILLSKCRWFVGGKTNGSLMALVFNGGKYEETYLYDKGLY